MKKTFVLLACSALSTIACNSGNTSDTSHYASGSTSDANEIIGYTNGIVDMLNKDMDYIQNVSRYLDGVNDGYKDDQAHQHVFVPSAPTANFSEQPGPFDKMDPLKPASALSKEDQTFFKTNIGSYKKTGQQLANFIKQENDYLTAENFKDDKWAKGKALVDSIDAYSEALVARKRAIMERINTVSDAAENVVLKDSPLRQPILDMKADMKGVKDFISNMDTHGEQYKTYSDSAQAAYDTLEKTQAQHAAASADVLKKEDKVSDYQRFYDDYHNFLLTAKKIMREAGDKGDVTDDHVHDLQVSYDHMISSYNSFSE